MMRWVTDWPICVRKARSHGQHNAVALLQQGGINVRCNSALLWFLHDHYWVYVPRGQAHQAERLLRRDGYTILAKQIGG